MAEGVVRYVIDVWGKSHRIIAIGDYPMPRNVSTMRRRDELSADFNFGGDDDADPELYPEHG